MRFVDSCKDDGRSDQLIELDTWSEEAGNEILSFD